MSIPILKSQEGIAQVLPPQSDEHLPSLDGFFPIGNGAISQDIENYKAALVDNALIANTAQNFVPEVLFNEQLQDHAITSSLQEVSSIFDKISNSSIRDFARNDLTPLLENKKLLQMFQGMMVQG